MRRDTQSAAPRGYDYAVRGKLSSDFGNVTVFKSRRDNLRTAFFHSRAASLQDIACLACKMEYPLLDCFGSNLEHQVQGSFHRVEQRKGYRAAFVLFGA